MSVTADFSEITKLEHLLADASAEVKVKLPGVLDKVADTVATQASASAPRDTGALASSVGVLRKSDNARWVGSDLRQAFFTEYGTSVMPPQPWLTPAAEVGVKKLEAELGKLGEPW